MTAHMHHSQDSVGAQIPGTAWGAHDFDAEILDDASANISRPNNQEFQIDENVTAGKLKFFSVNLRWKQDRNNRGTAQARLVQSTGSGAVVWSTYATSFTRNDANDEGWIRLLGVVQACASGDRFQVEWRRDSDAITRVVDGGSVPDASDCQIVDIHYSAIGIYTDSVGNQTAGLTTYTQLNLDTTVVQTDAAAIALSGNQVLMKTDGRKYLILGSVAGDTGGSRTQRRAAFAFDGTVDLATESYCYQRNSANEFAGMILQDLYEKGVGADVAVDQRCWLGAGVAADQGGADVAGSWNTTPGFVGMCVIELHEDAEGFRSHDSVGLQTISGVANVTLNAMRDEDFIDASYDGRTNSSVDANGAHRALVFSSILACRNNIASGVRGTMGARIEINGIDQSVGEHGNYSRGNQGSQDTFGWGANPGGVYDLADNATLEVETFDAGDNGGTDRTQAGSVSFFALNLDTLEPSAGGGFNPVWARNSNQTLIGAQS